MQRSNDPSMWWRDAVVYQVYIRSFADSNGDGVGDLAGLTAHLDYLASLGVDALWINPWYPSPMVDGGYDIADYRRIDPSFGTLADAEAFIAAAHARGLRVLADIVPNHTSAAHTWFAAALAGDREARAMYHFRPGSGPDGDLPPNDWCSAFGGSAWTRETTPSGEPGEWYLHLYSPDQPDLNWSNPEVRAEFEDILRFWFDRGADGLRIDVAHGLVKAEGLPDGGPVDPARQYLAPHPAWDQPGVHEIYRSWRRIADSYDPPRVFVAEAWVPSNERLAAYLRPDELHCAFQIGMLFAPWDAGWLRTTIDDAIVAARAVGAPATWVLSNHDVPRHVTRYARSQPDGLVLPDWERRRWADETPDLPTGRRRARAAVLLVAALPGSLYVYQGEELGLAEVEDIPDAQRQDPTWWQSGKTEPGRDGCRVPLPWSGSAPPFGFGPDGSTPWLPQPSQWAGLTVADQERDPDSMLALYRAALRLRRRLLCGEAVDGGVEQAFEWIDAGPGVVAFRRGATQCWVNLSDAPIPLPLGARVLLASQDVDDGKLGVDAAAYLTDQGAPIDATDPTCPSS